MKGGRGIIATPLLAWELLGAGVSSQRQVSLAPLREAGGGTSQLILWRKKLEPGVWARDKLATQ